MIFWRSHICAGCGSKVDPVKAKKGSVLILLILLLFFIIPGLIYLIWMLTNRDNVCPKCKSHDVCKISSRRGTMLMRQFGYTKEEKNAA